jgi:WD40 repeat protein
MAIYTNVVQEFRKEIEANLNLDDIIDLLIAQRIIDEKSYFEVWGTQNTRLSYLIDFLLKDGKHCAKFINILGTISHVKLIFDAIKSSIDGIRKVIVIGGFPEFSLNYVVRNSVANRIQEKALDLDPQICSTLVVHGLPGFGKSCLVNQVLQTKRFLEVSGSAMFWINLGEHSDTTTVINPLWNLYLTAVKLTDQAPLSHRPEDITVLQNEIKRLLLDERLQKSYIILDDVKSSEVLKVFKLSCKLIVTTQDKNIAKDSEAVFIQVTTGFTKKESLELLRKSLETDNLSTKEKFAHKLHELCDGCPMLLNIIGSILKDSREEALSTDIIWDSLINEIIEDEYLRHPITTSVIHMIQKFVTCLSPEVQKCFHSLAVFPKHVNIRPEILVKLWEKSYYAVRKIMVELENKSLIVSFFNKDLKTYIYSIHSLVRTYLVEKAQVDIKSYHKKMISQCDEITNKSPDDPIANYIFGYYGYHVKNAELYDKFDKYFDLIFIENKIKRVGSADLLTDFDTYKDFITKKKPRLERKLEDYIKFVNSYSAHLHISPETNIVQFAFFNDNNCAYEEAKNIASNYPDQLYFKLEPYSDRHKNFPILKTTSAATSVCFLDPKEVLVGTSSGSIEVKSFHQYHHKVRRFEGHTKDVFNIQLSPDGKTFLSISHDRTVKLWRFVEDLDPQSPKFKQTNWKNLHSPDENCEPHKTFKMQDSDYITSAAFPFDNSDEIITASNRGKIVRWNTRTAAIMKESSALGLTISRISYTHDSKTVMFSYDGNMLYLYQRGNLVYNGQLRISDEITDLLLPTSADVKEVVVITRNRFEIWNYVHKIKRFSFETDSKIISTVADNNESLAVGTANYIYLYNFRSQKVDHYSNDYGDPASVFVLQDRVAFICLDKESVQRCELYMEPSGKPIVHDLSLFSCHWKDSLPIYFIVNKENKIDIFNGRSTILTGIGDITDKIMCASFSLCGNYLILGTVTGKVYFYNYKKKKLSCLETCQGQIVLIKCFESDVENLDSYDSSNLYGMVFVASSTELVVIVDSEVKLKLQIADELSDMFYFRNNLITVDVHGNAIIRSLFDDGRGDFTSGEFNEVIVANIHKGKNVLAVASNDAGRYVVKVISYLLNSVRIIFETKLECRPKCLCFSSTGKLLAVGCDTGDIKVYNLEDNLQDVLAVHKKSVEKLLFAPNFEPILVSLGDQIAWWNLTSFQEHSENNSEVDNISRQLSVFTFDSWKDKKLHDTVPYLLTSTNLHGKRLQYISASKDFRSFLIIDIDGNIFKMDIIDS